MRWASASASGSMGGRNQASNVLSGFMRSILRPHHYLLGDGCWQTHTYTCSTAHGGSITLRAVSSPRDETVGEPTGRGSQAAEWDGQVPISARVPQSCSPVGSPYTLARNTMAA